MSIDRIESSNPLDARVTITLVVASIVLSLMRFQGSDFGFLMVDYETWPQEPWRLLTATLLHGDLLHLAFNAFWTFRFGCVVEAAFGGVALSAMLVFLGLSSSAAEWAFGGSGIGLSGIGYGLFAFLWALDKWHPAYRGVLDPRVAELFAAWFLICIALTYYDLMPIANFAHGAGAIFGGLLGWSISPRKKLSRIGITAAAFVVVGLMSTVGRPYLNYRPHFGELWSAGTRAYRSEDYAAAEDYYLAAIAGLSKLAPKSGDRTVFDQEIAKLWHNVALARNRLQDFTGEAEARRRELELDPGADERREAFIDFD